MSLPSTLSRPLTDPQTLKTWLEWAGGKLLALPTARTKPPKLRALWPMEYNQDPYEILQFRPNASFSIHAAAPTAEEITYMDRILILPNLCSDQRFRRVLHARSLVYPFNGRYLFPWQRLADYLQVSNPTVKAWHKKGLKEICEKITPNDVRLIGGFLRQ